MNYDVPKGVPRMQPLWFGWDSREMPEPDPGFASKMRGKVICFIVRCNSARDFISHSCQLVRVSAHNIPGGKPERNQAMSQPRIHPHCGTATNRQLCP